MNSEYNIRRPLPDGLQITDTITIESLLSQEGGSSLTYRCKSKDGIWYVLKEIYPLTSRVRLIRKGYDIIFERNIVGKEREKIELAFKNEKDNQGYLCDAGTSNSIYHFSYSDITDDVKKYLSAEKSLSHYLLLDTKKGYTLSELITKFNQQSLQFSTQKALTYVLKVAMALKRMHDEKNIFHLDIKPDNLFFSSEEGFCILLDCGTAIHIDTIEKKEIPTGIFSLSVEFAARELRYAANALRDMNEVSHEKRKEKFYKYFSQIGTHSDLYSLSAVLLNLLLGESEFVLISEDKTLYYKWNDIVEEDSNKQRTSEIDNAIHGVESIKSIADEITRILCKGLYFDKNNISELSTHRYKNCDEFIFDVKALIDDISEKGIRPIPISRKSLNQLKRQYEINRIQNVSFENINELPIDPDLIPESEIV